VRDVEADMTVGELIVALQAIEDQSLPVIVRDRDEGYQMATGIRVRPDASIVYNEREAYYDYLAPKFIGVEIV
jgi:hypothetical protein